jgi:Family of unknown function (DUF6134)
MMTRGNVSGCAFVRRCNALVFAAMVGVVVCGVFVCLFGSGARGAETPAQFVYRVSHSTFGEIGTYANTIQPTPDGVTVQTRVNFEVSMLGVRMYRENAERTEHWQGDRLVSFRGVTDKGKGPIEVRGEARGNSFLISSAQGIVTAPASVHPANPWSANFLRSNTMMRADSGQIEQVRIGKGQETIVKIDGASIPTVKFEIDGSTRYTVWIDGRGVPVMFVADDDTGKVTFTLAKCIHCGAELTQLGTR